MAALPPPSPPRRQRRPSSVENSQSQRRSRRRIDFGQRNEHVDVPRFDLSAPNLAPMSPIHGPAMHGPAVHRSPIHGPAPPMPNIPSTERRDAGPKIGFVYADSGYEMCQPELQKLIVKEHPLLHESNRPYLPLWPQFFESYRQGLHDFRGITLNESLSVSARFPHIQGVGVSDVIYNYNYVTPFLSINANPVTVEATEEEQHDFREAVADQYITQLFEENEFGHKKLYTRPYIMWDQQEPEGPGPARELTTALSSYIELDVMVPLLTDERRNQSPMLWKDDLFEPTKENKDARQVWTAVIFHFLFVNPILCLFANEQEENVMPTKRNLLVKFDDLFLSCLFEPSLCSAILELLFLHRDYYSKHGDQYEEEFLDIMPPYHINDDVSTAYSALNSQLLSQDQFADLFNKSVQIVGRIMPIYENYFSKGVVDEVVTALKQYAKEQAGGDERNGVNPPIKYALQLLISLCYPVTVSERIIRGYTPMQEAVSNLVNRFLGYEHMQSELIQFRNIYWKKVLGNSHGLSIDTMFNEGSRSPVTEKRKLLQLSAEPVTMKQVIALLKQHNNRAEMSPDEQQVFDQVIQTLQAHPDNVYEFLNNIYAAPMLPDKIVVDFTSDQMYVSSCSRTLYAPLHRNFKATPQQYQNMLNQTLLELNPFTRQGGGGRRRVRKAKVNIKRQTKSTAKAKRRSRAKHTKRKA